MPDQELIGALESSLGGRVIEIRRLSGGASRVTHAVDVERSGSVLPLIVQSDRGQPSPFAGGVTTEAALLSAASPADVPVADVVAVGRREDGRGWIAVTRLDGESIPRRILRDDNFAHARSLLSDQSARALAAIHRLDPASIDRLPRRDPLAEPLSVLDLLHGTRPALEAGWRWLHAHRPTPVEPSMVHGDFRLGNLLVNHDGLVAVLDWELAHAGDPAEDIGWLCHRSWRFGGPGRVGGVGDLNSFLAAYVDAGGTEISVERVTWWEAFAAVKWAVICVMQASAHLSGATRSVELATIGRRVVESEWDLMMVLGWTTDSEVELVSDDSAPFGHPTAGELIDAVLEQNESNSDVSYEQRVARTALGIVSRELRWGHSAEARHLSRLRDLGFADDVELASALRSGSLDDRLAQVGAVVARSVRDSLQIANPRHLVEN